ncbi:hypothetical protein BDF21DRAFT_358030 [Thamnidium elegans]|uniref:Uncharacterized protein n=1 Tax=Thamnidium elegans TaxID=101142 RepID=A0A8H7SMC9_9FUNG|nr:hypothetical protein INT48_003326 [Thamnidium elegans]KAI8088350.1 hypothetical protein BDF21DRAFT_358030 [Thamnidium elegans]
MNNTTSTTKLNNNVPRTSATSPRHSKDQHVNKANLPLSETDPDAARQKATEDKLQLLGTIQAMQQGRMPHNAQLDELLGKLISNKVITSREHLMSADGRILLNDFRKLLKTAQKSLAVKNKDELFQSLVYHLHCMEYPITKDKLGESMKVSNKKEVDEEGRKGSDALFQIGKLILLNNEFRSLLGELIDISQEIFSSVSTKAGDSLSNAGHGLQNDENHPNKSGKHLVDKLLDKALDPNRKTTSDMNPIHGSHPPKHDDHHRNSIHDQEPRLVSSSQDEPRRQGLLNTGDSVHPNAIPGGFPAANSVDGGLPATEQPLIDQQRMGAQQHGAAGTLGQQVPHHHQQQGALGSHNHQQPYEQTSIGNPNARVNPIQQNTVDQDNINSTTNEYQQKIESHPLYQKSKNEMYEHKDYARNTMKEKLPKEKQDELLNRLRLSLAQVQKHPEYQGAIKTLIRLIKVWSTRVSQVSEEVRSHAKQGDRADQANARERSERELKAIIECWAQGNSIDPLLHGVQDVMRDMQNDDHLRQFYQDVVHYVDRLVTEPGYVQREESTQEGRQLMDKGNHMIKGRYREHLNYLSTESRKIMRLMAEDEISQELNHRVATIHRDLWMDGEGNPAFKPHLLNDMRMTLLPAFIDEIKYIPIPRIEYSDSQYDIAIENLVISGDTLLPNVFETKVDSFNSFSLKSDVKTSPSRQSLYIRMSEIQAEINDVVFYYKKKTGFPKMTDHGVASLIVGGKGISISLRIQSVVDNPAKTFKVASCKCNVDNLKVKVNDSNHDTLYKAIQPLILGTIRKQIAKAIELKITNLLNQGDNKLTNYMVQMNQNLQNKAYQSLPEQDQSHQKPPSLSQARPRPGLFSTIVNIINNNIKTKVQKRNEAKRMERMSTMSPTSPTSIHSKTQYEGQNFNHGNSQRLSHGQHNDNVHHVNHDLYHNSNRPLANDNDPHVNLDQYHDRNSPLATDRHLRENTPHVVDHNRHDAAALDRQHHDDASMATDRHNFITSPPLSPTSKTHNSNLPSAGNNQPIATTPPNHYKLAQDLSDAQQQFSNEQLNRQQI